MSTRNCKQLFKQKKEFQWNFLNFILFHLVSDSDVQDFVLKLGPVDELLARPVRHISQNVDVQLEFSLRKLKHVVCLLFGCKISNFNCRFHQAQDIEMVTVYGFLMSIWRDEYRVWNNTFPYNCSKRTMIPATKVWIPDIMIRNSEQRFLTRDRNGEDVVIYSDGYSSRSVSGTITFYCPLNMAMFPFDVQTCSLIFDSWALDTSQQTFNIYHKGIRSVDGYESEEWDVTHFELTIGNATLTGNLKFAKVFVRENDNIFINFNCPV